MARLAAGQGWSFEGGGEIGEFPVVVEALEEVASYCHDVAHVKASAWQTSQ